MGANGITNYPIVSKPKEYRVSVRVPRDMKRRVRKVTKALQLGDEADVVRFALTRFLGEVESGNLKINGK